MCAFLLDESQKCPHSTWMKKWVILCKCLQMACSGVTWGKWIKFSRYWEKYLPIEWQSNSKSTEILCLFNFYCWYLGGKAWGSHLGIENGMRWKYFQQFPFHRLVEFCCNCVITACIISDESSALDRPNERAPRDYNWPSFVLIISLREVFDWKGTHWIFSFSILGWF